MLTFCGRSFSVLALIAVFGGVGHFFIVEPTEVNGRSMEESLHDEDVIVIEKLTLLFSKPERGQIVSVLDASSDVLLVKRIVGLPGEQVIIRHGKVFIVGTDGVEFQLEEPYLQKETVTLPRSGSEAEYPVLGEYEYFVMGDNRERSTDSRVSGAFHRADIVGIVRPLFHE